MKVLTMIGIDLAKRSAVAVGLDSEGKIAKRWNLKRCEMLRWASTLPVCKIGLESCGGSSYWARAFRGMGHEVIQIAPQFVKPFVKTNKNDFNDALAIVEAMSRPGMKTVAIKEQWQQDIQNIHRFRSRLINQQTAIKNELYAMFLELGVVLPKIGKKTSLEFSDELEKAGASERFRRLLEQMLHTLRDASAQIKECEKELQRVVQEQQDARNLMTIPGVGPLTATAIVAAVVNPHQFKNGRELSAWVGLVPRQASSGQRHQLLGISKRGDTYLRTLLVHGARSILRMATSKTDEFSKWCVKKQQTRGTNRAIVAIANKNTRIIWAVLTGKRSYELQRAAA